MKKLRKINNTFIFLFIILLCFGFYKCASVPCSSYCQTSNYISCINSPGYTCNNAVCKPKYGVTSQCYDCSGINTGNYYTIDQSGNCLINQCIGDKILFDTNECTSYILPGNYYRLGDVYYKNNPSNTNIECDSNNICKCKQYYYKEMINGKIKYTCLLQTDLGSSSVYKFFHYKTQELFKDQCPEGYKIIKETTNGVKRCSDTCVGDEFYQRTTVSDVTTEKCIDSCSPNYEYLDNGIKTCVSSCPENTYLKSNSECLTLDKCLFYSGNKCYDSCNQTPTPKKSFHNYGSKECISNCEGEYIYKDEDFNTDNNKKICYKREQCTFIDFDNKICYHTSCLDSSSNQYHNFDSNICKTGCIDNDRKYHTLNEKICYPSCIDIPGRNHIYELADYTCKKSSELGTNECPYYHINNYGVRKCFSFDQCIDNGYKYFIENKECRDNCEGYYKLDKTTSSSPSKPYVQCYENLDAVKRDSTIKYYHIKIKKCWVSFPEEYNYYIKGQTSDTQKELVDECEKFYYEKVESSKTRFYCIDDCKNISPNKYFVSGNKKCFDNCINAYKYYYYPDNKECLDSCELKTDKPFSEPLSTTLAQECKESCGSNKYYNFDSHICLNNCGADGSINIYHNDASDNTKYICYPSCSTIPGSYLYEVNASGQSTLV